ncbi:hypothetical protein F383_06422 [Gossypium arboreum]
MENRG